MNNLNEAEKIKILSDLVSIKTVNGNEIEVCDYLEDLFNSYGIKAVIDKQDDSRANLIAEIGSGQPVLAVSGHMDVVSEGNADNWSHDPFVLTEESGKLYGRGTADMKSGLAALVIAMIELKQNDSLQNGTLRLLATFGEEMEQGGSKRLYDNGYMDDVEALLIAEPSETTVVHAHKGSINFKVSSIGKSCHSSAPFMGKNAIKPLVAFTEELEQAFNAAISEINFKALDFTALADASRELLEADIDTAQLNQKLASAILTNTVLQGGNQVNSVPEYAFAEYNARTVPEFDNETLIALVKKVVEDYNQKNNTDLTLDISMDLPPVLTPEDNKLVAVTQQAAQKHLASEPIVSPTMGVTDASNLLKDKDTDFSFAMFGPGNPAMAHQTDEYVTKDSYLTFIELYKDIICDYLN